MRILVVEDEPRLRRYVCAALADAGFGTDEAMRFDEAVGMVSGLVYDAIVLDLGLPDGDGLDLIPIIREEGAGTPVLILTARDGVKDRVGGLDAGADDYLVKPFATEELVARVRALLRRPGSVLGRVLAAGNVTLDTVSRSACVADQSLILPRHESAVLEHLMRRQGKLVPKDILFDKIYGNDAIPETNTIPVHVHHLRKRLSEAGASIEIETHRGLGYLLSLNAGGRYA
jgi:DNA-binding response OmpR family regulator